MTGQVLGQVTDDWVGCKTLVVATEAVAAEAYAAAAAARHVVRTDVVLSDSVDVGFASPFGAPWSITSHDPVGRVVDELVRWAAEGEPRTAPLVALGLVMVLHSPEAARDSLDALGRDPRIAALPVVLTAAVLQPRPWTPPGSVFSEAAVEREALSRIIVDLTFETVARIEQDATFARPLGSLALAIEHAIRQVVSASEAVPSLPLRMDPAPVVTAPDEVDADRPAIHAAPSQAPAPAPSLAPATETETETETAVGPALARPVEALLLLVLVDDPHRQGRRSRRGRDDVARQVVSALARLNAEHPRARWACHVLAAGHRVRAGQETPTDPVDIALPRDDRDYLDLQRCSEDLLRVSLQYDADLRRRGSRLEGMHVVLLSCTVPLADAPSMEAYHQLTARSWVTWVLFGDDPDPTRQVSDEFRQGTSRVLPAHPDVAVEVMAVVADQARLFADADASGGPPPVDGPAGEPRPTDGSPAADDLLPAVVDLRGMDR